MTRTPRSAGLVARVSLRYRPGPDTLSATIDLSSLADLDGRPGDDVIPLATEIEAPDADTALHWADMGETQWLSGFTLVHAAARLRSGRLPLPDALLEPLVPSLRRMVLTAQDAVAETDSPVARLKALAESRVDVPLLTLERHDASPTAVRPDLVAPVSESLRRLSRAMHDRSPVDNELEAIRTDHLSRLLGELSSTISHAHGAAAPGTSAATRAAVRGGVPLTVGEQRLLEEALDLLADTSTWNRATTTIEHLAEALETHRHDDAERLRRR